MATGEEILLQFLQIGVIDVGADDTKLEKLRDAVAELAADLKKTPAKTIRYTLIAADPEAAATDPTIEDAMAVLRKHWLTVSNTFQTTPIAILRAMLLDTVVRCARQDDAIASAFVNIARNTLPFTPSANESAIWTGVVLELERKIDARAEAEWSTPETISIAPFAFEAPEPIEVGSQEVEIDTTALSALVLSAGSPNGTGNPNPYWPNNPQPWVAEFAPRMAKAIATTMETAMAEAAIDPIDFSSPLAALSKSVSAYVEGALAGFAGATAGLQRRTNLLWWKEALYSPSAQTSYRTLEAFEASALMALDLFEQVPLFSPASVSAFLDEAVRLLPDVADADERSVLELVNEARMAEALAPLREAASGLVDGTAGRGPVLAVLGHGLERSAISKDALAALTGLNAAAALQPAGWGLLLFRELQALRAVAPARLKSARRKA